MREDGREQGITPWPVTPYVHVIHLQDPSCVPAAKVLGELVCARVGRAVFAAGGPTRPRKETAHAAHQRRVPPPDRTQQVQNCRVLAHGVHPQHQCGVGVAWRGLAAFVCRGHGGGGGGGGCSNARRKVWVCECACECEVSLGAHTQQSICRPTHSCRQLADRAHRSLPARVVSGG